MHFHFLSVSLLLLLLLSSPSDQTSTDEISLLSIKASVISSDPTGILSRWDPSRTPHCQWPGVTCSPASGHVTSLDLVSSSLAGIFPADVANLTELRHLSFRGNNFTGPIPDGIVGLRSLKSLDLSHNSLAGPIPESLIGMHLLETLDLSSNRLTGKIRVGECKALTFLRLSSNFLVGNIPAEVGRCSKLKRLQLDRNILEGRVPAEIGRISGLRVLDLSKNSLTGRIPRDIGRCRNLSALVLTDLGEGESSYEEFNAFIGDIPAEILNLPGLEILWVPRANVDGRLPGYRKGPCSLRVLNLGDNYIVGDMPSWLGSCMDLEFLDLSSNFLEGPVPEGLGVRCMDYLNVSRNSLSGSLLGFSNADCTRNPEKDDVFEWYSAKFLRREVVFHDFSWNNFSGPLPGISLPGGRNLSYGLFLDKNGFSGLLSSDFFKSCGVVNGFAVNLSVNQIQGGIWMLSGCSRLKSFEAANNQLSGPIPPDIGDLGLLTHLDLRGNRLNGSITDQMGRMKDMERVLLGGNNLSGEIPVRLGEMASLKALDLSTNSLTGDIPPSLANIGDIKVLLLDHNLLSGDIPTSFGALAKLTTFDVSFNNLSGEIPQFNHPTNCELFKGNPFLQPCPSPITPPPALPFQTNSSNLDGGRNKLKIFVVASVTSASLIVSVLAVLVLLLIRRRRKLVRISNLKGKVVVTFSNAPAELHYENILKATSNFSIQNLIGSGGFGATYKAELVPGFVVAVKRLSIGRFQGLQQFDAEIRTLGRIRHKNLVTLIGYHMGDIDTFLIYNYLSGGNLEAFIRSMSGRNVGWSVIHKIALDVAQAIVYLHYSCVPRIVHRDIKPSNILLDEKLNAYLSDFGLARLLEVSQTHATTDVAGTFGYVAPEYATTCRVSHKADVYSYGVVLLELLSGKRSLDPSFSKYGNGFTIVGWGRLLIQEGRSEEFFCESLWDAGPKDNLVGMLRLALACTVESLSVRPSMKQVIETLKRLKN